MNRHETPTDSDGQAEKTAAPVHAETALHPDHRDYLLQRHGTVELDPIPANDPADPYNWPKWKVCLCVPTKKKEVELC